MEGCGVLEEKQFETGAVTINYGQGPSNGPPLLMLHGTSTWWRTFLPILPYLSKRFHVFAMDFRGHGLSGRVPQGYQWERYGEDAIAFLREVIREPAYVVGHSLGAMMALRAGALAPELLRAAVLEEPPLYSYRGERMRARPTHKLFVAWRDLARQRLTVTELESALSKLQPRLNPAALRVRAQSLALLDADVLSMHLDGVGTEGYDTDEYLRKIRCPVLILRGDPALGGAIENADEIHAMSLLPGGKVHRFSGVGHNIHPNETDVYQRLVASFFAPKAI
jgi:pimeloyl-ACP methyl ester carboxylesterase